MNENLMMVLLVAIGGMIGALMRFGVTMVLPPMEGIAWNTLLVNLLGCTLITMIFFGVEMEQTTRLFLFTGIFGAFTTMSAVSLETFSLYSTGDVGMAVANFMLNMTACVGGGLLGRFIALTYIV